MKTKKGVTPPIHRDKAHPFSLEQIESEGHPQRKAWMRAENEWWDSVLEEEEREKRRREYGY